MPDSLSCIIGDLSLAFVRSFQIGDVLDESVACRMNMDFGQKVAYQVHDLDRDVQLLRKSGVLDADAYTSPTSIGRQDGIIWVSPLNRSISGCGGQG